MCLGHLSNYAVVAQSLLNMGVDDGFVPTKIQDFYVNNEGKLDPNGVLPDFLKLDPNAPEGLVEEKFPKENFRVNGEMRDEILVYDPFLSKI